MSGDDTRERRMTTPAAEMYRRINEAVIDMINENLGQCFARCRIEPVLSGLDDRLMRGGTPCGCEGKSE